MGLWVQNVGVESSHIPDAIAAGAAGDPAALPAMPGWTWISIAEAVEEQALDGIVTRAAHAADARALAFSVEDSDVAYVVGATPTGHTFRLRINPEEGHRQDLQEAAAFAGVSPEPLAAALAQSYVFAEQGVHVLFATMGLLSEAPPAATFAVEEDEPDHELEEAASLVAAIRSNPRGRRWAAAAAIPFPGRWIVVAAEQTAGTVAASFCSRSDRIEIGPVYRDLSALRRDLTSPDSGVELGAWHEVPADVSKSLPATIAWALTRIT